GLDPGPEVTCRRIEGQRAERMIRGLEEVALSRGDQADAPVGPDAQGPCGHPSCRAPDSTLNREGATQLLRHPLRAHLPPDLLDAKIGELAVDRLQLN